MKLVRGFLKSFAITLAQVGLMVIVYGMVAPSAPQDVWKAGVVLVIVACAVGAVYAMFEEGAEPWA